MIIALVIFHSLILGLFGLGIVLYKNNRPTDYLFRGKVSVLLAVRNEENNVYDCLVSLSQQEIDPARYEILVGDDLSEDETIGEVMRFMADFPNSPIQLYRITTQLGKARGKSNVLAQLAHKASGDIFAITDADVRHTPQWLSGMLDYYKPEIGIIAGVSTCKDKSFFDKMQGMDWVLIMSVVRSLAMLKKPVTCTGNNMMVSREAYFSIGGYESLDFNITEDIQLFKKVVMEKGWGYVNVFDERMLTTTDSVNTVGKLLQQRKRWMSGTFMLPFYMLAVIFPLLLFYGASLALLVLDIRLGIIFLLSKVFMMKAYMSLSAESLGLRYSLKDVFLFEVYSYFLSICSVIYWLIPIKIKWKGRSY